MGLSSGGCGRLSRSLRKTASSLATTSDDRAAAAAVRSRVASPHPKMNTGKTLFAQLMEFLP
jgi:hypothetical protein